MPVIQVKTEKDIPNLKPVEGPMLSTGPVESAGASIRRSMATLGRSAENLESTIRQWIEKENQAGDALEAVRLQNSMNELTDKNAESYAGRVDFEKFDEDLQKQIQGYDNLAPKNPRLQLVFERAKGNYTNQLSDVVRSKKYSVMSEQGQVEAIKLTDRKIEDYTNASTDEEKQAIVDSYKNEMGFLGKSNLINPVWVQQHISAFENVAKKMNERITYKKAFNAVMLDPESVESVIETFKVPEERQDELRKQSEIEIDRRWRREEHTKTQSNRDTEDFFFKKINLPGFAENQEGGHLTIREIADSSLDVQDKLKWTNILKNSVSDKKITTDPNLATRLMDNILSGNLKGVRERILSETSKDPSSEDVPRLTTNEAQELLRAYYAKSKGEKEHYTSDPWFGLTREYFRTKLGIKEGETPEEIINRIIKGGAKPGKNMEHYFNATSELMKAVEQKKLKGTKIWEEGQTILTTYLAESAKPKKEPVMSQVPPPIPPPGKVEGIYNVNGVEWGWSKDKGWFKE